MRAGVGARVCHAPRFESHMFIGYVERVENNRVKVSIPHAVYKSSKLTIAGFKPHDMWLSPPHDWYLCE